MRQKTEDLTLEPYNPLTEIYGALGSHVKKNKWLIAPFLWNEWPELTADANEDEKKDIGVDFLDFPLVDKATNTQFGEILGIISLNEDEENYFFSVNSAPTVEPDNELYYEPVALQVNSGTGKISFIIEPHGIQPVYLEGQTNYRVSMSFHKDENETYPRWHTYKRPFNIEDYGDEDNNEEALNNTLDQVEIIDSPISDAELSHLFIESAAHGCLPGFNTPNALHAHFSPDHFDQLTPYPKIWSRS